MSLTPKQEKFCQAIADGGSQADAYRAAYNAEKMSDKQVWEEASKLAKNPKVAQRCDDLREALANELLWTRRDSVEALKKVVGTGSGSEVTGAVKELNSMHGYNEPSKVHVTGQMPTTINLVAPKPDGS